MELEHDSVARCVWTVRIADHAPQEENGCQELESDECRNNISAEKRTYHLFEDRKTA
jgi:hypothetical protein